MCVLTLQVSLNDTFTNFPYFTDKTSYSRYYLPIFHALLWFSFAAKNLLYLGWKILAQRRQLHYKIRNLRVKSRFANVRST